MPTSTLKKAQVKAQLRRSQFLLGLARARRGLVRDIGVLASISGRKRQMAAYFDTHRVRKLQIGASHNALHGWLNTDICPVNSRVIFLDATKRFPFGSGTFDYIMSEHMIEHVDYSQGLAMLRECYRVLRSGGRVRIATPDLNVLLSLYSGNQSKAQLRYIDWAISRFVPEAVESKPVFVINNFFQSWGHRFLYDRETLRKALALAGFGQIASYRPGNSDDPMLTGLESHGRKLQAEDINDFETFVLEAVKG